MEKDRASTVCILIWIMLVTDLYFCESLIMDVPPKSGIIGKNRATLECGYSAGEDEVVTELHWSRRRDNEAVFTDIASFDPATVPWFTPAGMPIQNRTELNGDNKSFDIVFNKVVCSDEATYRCTVAFVSYASVTEKKHMSEEMSFTLEATPLHLNSLTVHPNKNIFGPDEIVELTCRGIVGKPPGVIWWFMYRYGVETDVTNMAVQTKSYPDGPHSCSVVEESTIRMSMKNILVQCKLFEKTQTEPFNQGCSQLCLQTEIVGRSSRLEAKQQEAEIDIPVIVVVVCAGACVLVVGALLGTYVITQHKNNAEATKLPESSLKYDEFDGQTSSEPECCGTQIKKPLSFLKKKSKPEADRQTAAREVHFENTENRLGQVWAGKI